MPLKRPKISDRKLTAIIAVLLVLVAGGLGYSFFEGTRTHTLVLAAGGRDGESYILTKALAVVVQRHYPRVHLDVRETGGSAENLAMLSDGRAQVATAQADVPTGSVPNLVAVLYRDDLQVFVRKDANIIDFAGLRGKRIGLTRRGGQYQSFLVIANRLGLGAADFKFIGEDDTSADQAFLDRRADAVFRVRAAGNASIGKLVQSGVGHFIPIEQAAALHVITPAFEPSVIPQGVYASIDPQPLTDTPTVGVRRTLLANRDASPSDIYAITDVLFSDRQEIAEQIPSDHAGVRSLLGEVKEAGTLGGIVPRVHPGAKTFFERNKPSFILEHSSFVGLLVTLGVIVLSWLRELKRRFEMRRKTEGDRYTDEVIQLLLISQKSNSLITIEAVRSQLVVVLTEAVRALDLDQISNESFQNIRGVWQIALELQRERALFLSASESQTAAQSAP